MSRELSEMEMGEALAVLLGQTTDHPANQLTTIVEAAARLLGASSARVLIAGRAFSGREVVVTGVTRPLCWCR